MLDEISSTKKIRGKMRSDDRGFMLFTGRFNGPSMDHRRCKFNVGLVDQKDTDERKRTESLGNFNDQTSLRIF